MGFGLSACAGQQTKALSDADKRPPQWAEKMVWYQIFVERFNNGDTTNDPGPENISNASASFPLPADWHITRWTSDWYKQEDWAHASGKSLNESLQYRRYGGDLQGVLDKLDYLQDLGVTAIYLNPINDAPSLHKYDARYYHHVDVNFGPDPEGDLNIIATEDPADPATWKWTSADKLFLKLIDELHRRNMKVIVDYSWNHTGVEFWAWKDVVQNQEKSRYADWYAIRQFDDPVTAENEFDFEGWLGIKALPEIRKADVTTSRKAGLPYEGDLAPGPKAHVFDVTRRWLAPDGDASKGVDGFRLDVADQIGLKFWRDYRRHVKSINPQAYLVGEIWWEEWPDRLMDPTPYTSGDVFDAVMFYQAYRPARSFFARADSGITAAQLQDSLQMQWDRLKPGYAAAMMNLNASHDAPRLLTCFYNGGKYKYNASGYADSSYKVGKPDEETYARVKLYLMHQFSSIGAPHIWNGDELGMWGADDPDCRKPLWWPGLEFDHETSPWTIKRSPVGYNHDHFEWYRKLANLRKSNSVLQSGSLEWIESPEKVFAYKRTGNGKPVWVVLNASGDTVNFNLPENRRFTNLLQPGQSVSHALTLGPFEGVLVEEEG